MNTYYVNPYLFFLINSGNLHCWDYRAHQQYEMNTDSFETLLKVAEGNHRDVSLEVLEELERLGFISPKPYTEGVWQWDTLSKIFHQGTQNIGDLTPISDEAWTKAALAHSLSVSLCQQDLYYNPKGIQTPLHPNPHLLQGKTLLSTLLERRTSRQFSGGPVDLETLATLLYYSFGTVHKDDPITSLHIGLRKTSPSAGGLHPTEAFITVFNIKGLEPGIYHYNVQHNCLTLLETHLTQTDLKYLFYDQPFIVDNSFGIFLASRFEVIWKKYPHSRSYRDALIEAGHVSQTALLLATALNLRTWETALFHDQIVAYYLGINGSSFAPLFFLCFGPQDS